MVLRRFRTIIAKNEAKKFKKGYDREKRLEDEVSRLEKRGKQLDTIQAQQDRIKKLEERKMKLQGRGKISYKGYIETARKRIKIR